MRRTVYALIALAGVAAFAWVQSARTAPAIGGEALLLALPLWAWFAETVVRDLVGGGFGWRRR